MSSIGRRAGTAPRGVQLRWTFRAASPMGFLCIVLSGCAIFPGTHYVENVAPFYKTSPQQATPQDGFLESGAKVWIFEERKDGYSRVWTEDGELVYVWSRSLVPWSEWKPPESKVESKTGTESGSQAPK